MASNLPPAEADDCFPAEKVEDIQIQVLALDPNALVKYCGQGNISVVKELIENGAEVNASNKDGYSPLHEAVRANSMECIQILLDKGAFVDPIDNDGSTPLHCAAEVGSVAIMETLISLAIERNEDKVDKGSPEYAKLARSFVCQSNSLGNTALHVASFHGHPDCVDCLIAHGADVDATNEKGCTALHQCAESGHDEIIDILVDEGANIDATDEDGNTPLHFAAIMGHCNCVDLLAVSGCDLMTPNIDGLTCLHLACLNEKKDVVSMLLEGTDEWEPCDDVDVEDEFGRTALHAAASVGNVEICQLLLLNNCQLKKLDEDGKTAIIWVVNRKFPRQGDRLILQCLQQFWKWWDVDSSDDLPKKDHADETGKNALHYACYNGLINCVKFLIGKKFDVNLQDCNGRTPMHYSSSSKICTQALLQYKGIPKVSDHLGAQPIHLAGYFCSAGSMEELLKIDSKFIHAMDQEDNTPLHYLANNTKIVRRSAIYCVEFLMTNKRELLDAKNASGQTAIHVASSCGNVVFLESVMEHISKLELSYYFNTKDEQGRGPIHIAAINGHSNVFSFLVSNGIDGGSLDKGHLSALHLAVIQNQHEFIQQVLDDNTKIDVNTKDNDGRSPFFYACWNGFTSIIDVLLLYDVDLEAFVDNQGNSALHTSVEGDRVVSIRLIMDEDPDEDLVNKPNKFGLTPVHVAAGKNSSSCLQELLQYECNVNMTDTQGRTPLHYACYYGNASCATMLIESGADVNVLDKDGNSSLFFASYSGHLPCVSLLLRNHARVLGINSGGRTSLHAAAWCGSLRACETLLEANKNLLEKTCNNGRTPLHRAAVKNHIRVMEYLVSMSADIDCGDSNGATPLMLACYHQKVDAVHFLVKHNANTDIRDELERTVPVYAKRGAKTLNDSSKLQEILSLLSSS